ncbi:MAG: hypothetical protein ABWZ88_12790 [Variovorax sp.]
MLPVSRKQLDIIRTESRRMVKRRATASGAAVLIPLPGVDVAADIGLLSQLLPAINRKFGLTPEQIDELDPQLKSVLYGAIKQLGNSLVGRNVTRQLALYALRKVGGRVAATQVLKYVPVAGQVAAAALSGGAMLYVGFKHIDECYEIALKGLESAELGAPAAAVPRVR